MAGFRLLIGLFALLGLAFAALVGQNLTNSRNRSRQRKTMGVLRTVMTCVEAYAVDHAAYPEARRSTSWRGSWSRPIRDLPRTDG
jgi:type II secretory pathway pseudopilin PulG